MNWVKLSLLTVLILSLLGANITYSAGKDQVEAILSKMTPEEKVGQLFLVTFSGSNVSPDSPIGRLIQEFKVGGVVISAKNGNFSNGLETPTQVLSLTQSLQSLALNSTSIPLFIGISRDGDFSQLRSGFTLVPNYMAIGATWDESQAELVGSIVGAELAAVGINMLLGPSLDVVDRPEVAIKSKIGTKTFGGDPYWVGKMGKAYIKGVHSGSKGRVITVAKHFPGRGGSDRPAEEEVATIQKSVQELRKIELAPFLAVTQAQKEETADALMSSHIRYRGFQGNIRELTPPLSLHPQGLGAILSMPEFASWREKGGIFITESLGAQALKRYYDPQLSSFPFKRIAQEAFLAGNDILFLSDFSLSGSWEEHYENIIQTILFFREKYVNDPTFRARVDESCRRILSIKLRLYPHFSTEEVLTPPVSLEAVGSFAEKLLTLAARSITLVYPDRNELGSRMPSPPLSKDQILIFSDNRIIKDCPDCPEVQSLPVDALESIMLRLYGPKAIGQIEPEKIHSFPFSRLKSFLASPGEDKELEALFSKATWLIFAMQDLNPEDYPASDAFKELLRRRPELLRDKKVIAISFGAPYYLDTTEISKLTAYYAAYSPLPYFIEYTVRALFQEFIPHGAPPVSVPGANYDLIVQTEPDPDQVIELQIEGAPVGGESKPLDLRPGSSFKIRTGVILDRNGYPVPDGTPVVFRLFYPAESLELPRREVTTVNGIAEVSLTLERTGQLEITASSLSATKSTKIVVTVQENQPAILATVVPPPTPTFTPVPTPTPTPTPSPTPTPTPAPASGPTPSHFTGAVAGIILAGAISQIREARLRIRLRRLLLVTIAGLAGYIACAVIAILVGGEGGKAIVKSLPFVSSALALALSIFGLRRKG
jgi:beta-N-acetylhexosaminidase